MSTLRSTLLLVSAALLFGCSNSQDGQEPAVTTPPPIQAGSPPRPNIVFILLDDMGWNDAGYNGSEIATPNLDRMANAGMRLDRNYVYPICSPTRAALLTGRSPLEYGIDGPMSDDSSLPTDVRIMPEYLKDLGYQTFLVGKWHLGLGKPEYFPTSRGFDYSYGFLGGWVDFYTHVYNGGLDWQRNGELVRETGHTTDLMTADAARVITSRDATRPFFLYLSYNAPHSPLQNTPTNSGLNAQIPPGDRSVYAEMMTHADAGIGQVLATLEAEGILNNTIVIFSSDNGGALNLGASNGMLRAGKGFAYEGGMRVPGLIWWPGHVEGGKTLAQQIVVHDWLPTLLEAVGGDPAVVENAYGQSMWAAIASDARIDRRITTLGVEGSRAVFDWPWKLVSQYGNRAGDTGGVPQLFNVVEDPAEKQNLAAQHPDIYNRLIAVLEAMPNVPSRRERGPTPNTYFRKQDGTGWDYDVRVKETREPWVEVALQSGN